MNNPPPLKIVRSWRKTLSLHVLPDSTLLVKAPFLMPRSAINSFIEHHEDWIQKKVAALKNSHYVSERRYVHGETFLFLGKSYMLTVGNYDSIQIREDKLLFPHFLFFRIRKEIETWYIRQAKQIIQRQVEWYARQMQVTYISISFSDTKSKWGSCTHHNKLQFNWRLIMAPMSVVDYLVIHELTHVREKNHSRDFWNVVRRMDPSYKIQDKWLKKHGDKLTLAHQNHVEMNTY